MKVSVIVGRFQSDQLHMGHRHLIQTAASRSDKLAIFIGSVNKPPSHNNPLNFQLREKIIKKALLDIYRKGYGFSKSLKTASILPIPDHGDDKVWVADFDSLLNTMFRGCEITLYVGRDSGLDAVYKACGGKYPVVKTDFKAAGDPSATKDREHIDKRTNIIDPASVIWTTQNQYPKVYPTVDAVVRDRAGFVILIRKKEEKLWRFPGGFVDPSDESYEAACRREVAEECGGIEITGPYYVGSFKINDPRYRGEKDKIITTLFSSSIMFGPPKASDDAAELLSFAPMNVDQNLMEEHKPLWKAYQEYLKK